MPENNKRTGEGITPSHPDREGERLRRDIYRPDIEKLKLFTKMLRQNALFKKSQNQP
jgi:hypothetical protein